MGGYAATRIIWLQKPVLLQEDLQEDLGFNDEGAFSVEGSQLMAGKCLR
jgi:hypothetical protein